MSGFSPLYPCLPWHHDAGDLSASSDLRFCKCSIFVLVHMTDVTRPNLDIKHLSDINAYRYIFQTSNIKVYFTPTSAYTCTSKTLQTKAESPNDFSCCLKEEGWRDVPLQHLQMFETKRIWAYLA